MICKKCGTECPDGNIFCEACGAELDTTVLPENIDEKGRVKKMRPPKEKPVKPTKPVKAAKPAKEKPAKKPLTAEQKAKLAKTLRAATAVVLAALVIIGVGVLVNIFGASDGFVAAQKIPVGRNVEFAEAETGLHFDKKCSNGMINNMASFDYICISDKTTKVSGSEQPKWVILLKLNSDNIITSVEYYDFTQLKLNWKGRKMAEMLDQNSLDYGMSIKNVNKKLGLKPYYIKRTITNDSTYCYRYYFTDTAEGYDRSFNYYVEFSDVELAVKNVDFREINYAATILSADGQSAPAKPAEVKDDLMEEDELDEILGESDGDENSSDEDE